MNRGNGADADPSKAPTYMDVWREAVWADQTLTATEKLVLLALGRFADWHSGEQCRPGAAKIVELTGLSRSCVLRTMTGLEVRGAKGKSSARDKGWLEVKSRGKSLPGKARTTTVYRLVTPPQTVGTAGLVPSGLQAQEDTTSAPESRTVGTEAPYLLKNTSGTSSSSRESAASQIASTATGDDIANLGHAGRDQRISDAGAILGAHDHDRARLAGVEIGDQAAYRRACIARRCSDPELADMAVARPDLSAEDLAGLVERNHQLSPPTRNAPTPVDGTVAAGLARMAHNARRSAGLACASCADTGWIERPDGTVAGCACPRGNR